jgi:DNA-binding response OmpR family regulator
MQIGVETSRALENKRVFVVDSDEVTRAALQFILHDENETHELAGLEEAFARSEGRRVDLLLLGSAIVEEKGMGVLGEAKAGLPGSKVLVVMKGAATDASTKEFAQRCTSAGADGVLLKPFTVESVRQRVDNILGRRIAGPMVALSSLR